MRLADFILRDMENILVEWEAFAGTLFPAAASMTPLALRDDAKEILEAVAKICQPPDEASSDRQISRKSSEIDGCPGTAAQTHAILRARRSSTSTSWPPNTAPCAPASFACGPNHVSLTTLSGRCHLL